MKKIKNTLALSLACFLPLCMTACAGETIEADPNKTQLYIGNYDGGVGREWIETLADKFEELYAEESFEEGKKGVQIWVNHLKEEYKSARLITTMDNYREDIYILDSITYGDFVSQDKLMDLTDVMTQPNELDGGAILAEKTDESRLDYFRYTDGKYYALPFMDHMLGIIYDVDLFEEENLFNGGVGVDGKEGTYDDGLPATEAEFWQLIDVMKQKGITPFTWCGKDGGYRIDLLNEIWAKYEGKENFELNNTFDGEYTFEGNSEPTVITAENGYLLTQQTGKLKALEFAKKLLSDPANFSKAGFYASQMHTDTQEEFLTSCRRPQGSNQIAMILEGSWFENEADPIFEEMAETFGAKYARGKRRFAFMPLPYFEGGSEENTLYMGKGQSAIVVKKEAKNPDLCKMFLKYLHTNENLGYFNAQTGVTRPYTYTMTQEQEDCLSYLGKSLRAISANDDVVKVYRTSADRMHLEKESFFNEWGFVSTIGAKVYNDPFLAFNDSANKDLTARVYFDGLANTYTQDKWIKNLSEYFD